MQQDGLISRESNPADAPSTTFCLVPAARATIEKATPGHVANASGCGERTSRKWMPSPSTVSRYCGKMFSRSANPKS